MYTQETEFNKEMITSDKLFKLARRSKKPKIYNPKTNRMIAINGPAYNQLLRDEYIHWREERLLIPPFNEMPILRKCLSFASNKIWNIVAEKSLLTKIDGKLTLLDILLKANWNELVICNLLKLCWNGRETREWRNNILMNFLHHPNLTPSKYRPNALYDAFSKADVLGPEHILAIARTLQ
ncbi:15309_t:CDS:1 [Entrophospora sp. SA101]|nr:15392_t:CDS:1 [Entrophospora sp. SA101]CAJ0843554.1 15309_t:CDS:1 [Entrophospora sp. SA101]